MAQQDYDDFDDDLDQVASDEPEIRPRASLLTVLLCVLNIAAAAGFGVVLMMDYSKRQEWSYAVFLHDLAIHGLPLEQEAEAKSGSRETAGKRNLSKESLREAFTKERRLPSKGEFLPVEEEFQHRIKPQHLSKQALSDHFKAFADGNAPASWKPVKTLEEEIARIKNQFRGVVAKAAQDYAGSLKDSAKLTQLRRLSLSLARTPTDIDKISAEMSKLAEQQANAGGAAGNFYKELTAKLAEAAERSMLYEVLLPLEHFRSAPFADDRLQQIADKQAVKTAELYDMVDSQFDAAVANQYDPKVHFGKPWEGKTRDSVEKRDAIAYLLFTVGQVRKPDSTFLFDQGPNRVRAVVGLREDVEAAQAYTDAWVMVAEDLATAITEDRDGIPYRYQQDKFIDLPAIGLKLNVGRDFMVGGFVNEYNEQLHQLGKIASSVKHQQAELKDFQNQEVQQDMIVKDMTKRVQAVTDQLVEARQKSAVLIKKLRDVQKDFFVAQSDLADAHAKNVVLLRKIREMEKTLKGGRGQ